MILRAACSILSPAGPKARLSIFIYHRVLENADPLFPDEVDRVRFDQSMSWISEWFTVLPLGEAVTRLSRGNLPARAASITFDDGYADNYLHALPILQRHGLKATFFISTGFLDGGRMWNDSVIESVRNATVDRIDCAVLGLGELAVGTVAEKRAALERIIPAVKHLQHVAREDAVQHIMGRCGARLPSDLMLTTAQLRALHAANMEIGAHTVSHPILANCSDADALREMGDSRDQLQSILGTRVGLFAYPNGKFGRDYRLEHREMARRLGFDAAVSTNWGANAQDTDPFQLNRFTPWDRTRLRFGLRALNNLRSTQTGSPG